MTEDTGIPGAGIADRVAMTGTPTGKQCARHRNTIPLSLRQALFERTDRFPQVRVVRDYATLQQVGRIRYRQYVQGQGKGYASIVLDRDCLIEPCDFRAVNIYASDGRGITCAMRIGEASDREGPYADLIGSVARQFDVPLGIALTCTRLVRAPRHSGRHVVDLINFVRWQTVQAGWRYCIMQTAERLVPFFRRFEFKETDVWSEDGAAGRLQALILDTQGRPSQKGDMP